MLAAFLILSAMERNSVIKLIVNWNLLTNSLTVWNDHHSQTANHFQGPNDPSVPFGGDFDIEECGQWENFGIFHIFLSL